MQRESSSTIRRTELTAETMTLLLRLADESGLKSRIEAMFGGERINVTEDRPVLHVALRAPETQRSSGRRRQRRARGARGARPHGLVRDKVRSGNG